MQIRGKTLWRHGLASNIRGYRKSTPGPQLGSLLMLPPPHCHPSSWTVAPVTRGSRLVGQVGGAPEVLAVRRVSGKGRECCWVCRSHLLLSPTLSLLPISFLPLTPLLPPHTHKSRASLIDWLEVHCKGVGVDEAKLPANPAFLSHRSQAFITWPSSDLLGMALPCHLGRVQTPGLLVLHDLALILAIIPPRPAFQSPPQPFIIRQCQTPCCYPCPLSATLGLLQRLFSVWEAPSPLTPPSLHFTCINSTCSLSASCTSFRKSLSC